MRSADWERNAISISGVDGPPMESLEWPPNVLNQRAGVIKPLHMPLQAGVPGPAACPAPLLPVPACFNMNVPVALNSTMD